MNAVGRINPQETVNVEGKNDYSLNPAPAYSRPVRESFNKEPAADSLLTPELTPEQAAFLHGRTWSRDPSGNIIVLADGPIRGHVPRGVRVVSKRGNRKERRRRGR